MTNTLTMLEILLDYNYLLGTIKELLKEPGIIKETSSTTIPVDNYKAENMLSIYQTLVNKINLIDTSEFTPEDQEYLSHITSTLKILNLDKNLKLNK